MFLKLKLWLQRFMMGRYGMDQLSLAMTILAAVLMVLSQLCDVALLYWLSFALMVTMLVRSYSRNVTKRAQENQWFMAYFNRACRWFNGKQQQWRERKDYCFFKCPTCGQRLRVPRGKGKICITCPKCSTELIRKT